MGQVTWEEYVELGHCVSVQDSATIKKFFFFLLMRWTPLGAAEALEARTSGLGCLLKVRYYERL